MASKIKRMPQRRTRSYLKADNQGHSELCVRYSIAKAVSHYLYVNEKIDIDHSHIMISLVQAMKSIDSVNPTKYDGKVIYLQDIENRRGIKPADFQKAGGMNALKAKLEGNEVIPDKSWWEITIHVKEVTSDLKDDDSIYDEKETYVLGYSPSKFKDPSLAGPTRDGHCVFMMKRYQKYSIKKKIIKTSRAKKGKIIEKIIKLRKVYHCLNSWGFIDPFLTIPTDHPAVMGIYRITPTARRMIPN